MKDISKKMDINPNDFVDSKPDCKTSGLFDSLRGQSIYLKSHSECIKNSILKYIGSADCISGGSCRGIELSLDAIFLELDASLGIPEDLKNAEKSYTYDTEFLCDIIHKVYDRIEMAKCLVNIMVLYNDAEGVVSDIKLTKRNITI